MARLTGLEPAAPGVTGRYSNQLSYNRAISSSTQGANVRAVLGAPLAHVKRFCARNTRNFATAFSIRLTKSAALKTEPRKNVRTPDAT